MRLFTAKAYVAFRHPSSACKVKTSSFKSQTNTNNVILLLINSSLISPYTSDVFVLLPFFVSIEERKLQWTFNSCVSCMPGFIHQVFFHCIFFPHFLFTDTPTIKPQPGINFFAIFRLLEFLALLRQSSCTAIGSAILSKKFKWCLALVINSTPFHEPWVYSMNFNVSLHDG